MRDNSAMPDVSFAGLSHWSDGGDITAATVAYYGNADVEPVWWK
jgi:hypothetical protein